VFVFKMILFFVWKFKNTGYTALSLTMPLKTGHRLGDNTTKQEFTVAAVQMADTGVV
jgi:hypothetical protein